MVINSPSPYPAWTSQLQDCWLSGLALYRWRGPPLPLSALTVLFIAEQVSPSGPSVKEKVPIRPLYKKHEFPRSGVPPAWPVAMLPPSSRFCLLAGHEAVSILGRRSFWMRPVKVLAMVLKAAGFGGWRDRIKAIYAQEVQSWHRRIHCILVPAAEVALWPQCHLKWLLGFANSRPATSETVPLGSFPCNCLPAPQIQVCIQMPPRRITRGAEGRTAKGAVSFCGSVVFLSCPQGIRDPSSAWEGVCKIKSSAAKAGNAMESRLGMLFEYSLFNHHN